MSAADGMRTDQLRAQVEAEAAKKVYRCAHCDEQIVWVPFDSGYWTHHSPTRGQWVRCLPQRRGGSGTGPMATLSTEQAKRPRCETHGRSSMSCPPDGTCEDCRLVYLAGLPRAAA